MITPAPTEHRTAAFGQSGLTTLERVGVWWSHRAVARVLHAYERPCLLDIGSGFGARLVRHFHGRLGASTVVDVTLDPALRTLPGVSCMESPLEQAWERLPLSGFDVITVINVLEHLWEPQAVLAEAARRLRPGGTLVVNVPTWLGKSVHEFQAFRLGLSSAVEIDDHKAYYDKRDLWPLLVRAGFKPSCIRMRYHKLRLNLFATARTP